jgi:dihydrofolate reductase
MIYIVAAHDQNNGIGYKGAIPWPRIAEDKKYFHSLIHGKDIVMGMNEYQEGYQRAKHVYSTRKVYVLSRSKDAVDNAEIVGDITAVLKIAKQSDIWVIGGAQVYEQLLPYADKMYLTIIDGVFPADTYFPAYRQSDWHIVKSQSRDPDDTGYPHRYTFLELERKHADKP